MSAGHSVYTVVDKYDGYILAAIASVNGFGRSNGGQIAVTLIGEYHFLGVKPFYGRCDGRRTSVGSLDLPFVRHSTRPIGFLSHDLHGER